MKTPRYAPVILALTFLAPFLPGCAEGLWNPTKGRVALTVKWPQKSVAFRILAIPESTVRIDVTIRGEGISEDAPLKTSLTPDSDDNSTQFIDVPIGPKFIQAVGYDAQEALTSEGATAIAVLPNTMVEARLVMQPLTAPTPDPEASNPSETPEPELPQPVVSPGVHRIIDTYAGDGREGAQDSYDPLAARFRYPRSLLYDAEGQFIYVSDAWYRLIRKIDLKTGGVTTFGGRAATPTGAPAGVPPALAGAVSGVPSGLALGPDGSLYFCDRENHMVRRITATGLVETVAGTGRMGNSDGPLNFAQFAYPADLAVTREGVVYVADAYNNRIRRIENGSVTTIAGEGTSLTAELMGLRLPAPTLNLPVSIVLSADGGALFVGEGKGHRVSRVDVRTGEIVAFAGNGVIGTEGEDGPATSANVALPLALAFDSQGQLLIADGWALTTGVETLLGSSSRVLRVDSEGGIARLAGVNSKSAYGYSGDTEDARQAALNNPSGLAVDASGRIFIADSYNNRIRVLRAVVKPENTEVEVEETDTVATDSLASPTAFRAR